MTDADRSNYFTYLSISLTRHFVFVSKMDNHPAIIIPPVTPVYLPDIVNPLGGLSPNFFGGRGLRHNHAIQMW